MMAKNTVVEKKDSLEAVKMDIDKEKHERKRKRSQ
jgi:hypothetical protein